MQSICLSCFGRHGIDIALVCSLCSAPHARYAHQDPEQVQHGVGSIPLKGRAPCQQYGVYSIEGPDKKEGAGWPEPTDQAETGDTHQHTDHLDGMDAVVHELIGSANQAAPADGAGTHGLIATALINVSSRFFGVGMPTHSRKPISGLLHQRYGREMRLSGRVKPA